MALDVLVDALVVGDERVAALVIADGHALAAAPADREALQQRGPSRAGPPARSVPMRVAFAASGRRLCSNCSKVM